MSEIDLRRERKYRVFGDLTEWNDIEKRYDTRTVSFYDDTLRVKANWEAEFDRQYRAKQYDPSFQFVSLDIWGVQHNKRYSH